MRQLVLHVTSIGLVLLANAVWLGCGEENTVSSLIKVLLYLLFFLFPLFFSLFRPFLSLSHSLATIITLMVDTVSTSETSINFYQTA
jgi:hypothetical protein